MSEAVTYSKVSSDITSMIGHTTRVLWRKDDVKEKHHRYEVEISRINVRNQNDCLIHKIEKFAGIFFFIENFSIISFFINKQNEVSFIAIQL